MIEKLISGGQTGADRAALEWAIARGIPHGGWCPRGRKAEDGTIDARYSLRETPSEDYAQRTAWNVRDADGTVIFSLSRTLRGGSQETAQFAEALGRAWIHLSGAPGGDPAAALRKFVFENRIKVLNVAGPRASQEPGVGAFVQRVLTDALSPT